MVVAATLMAEKNLTCDEGIELLRSKPNGIRPNPAFMELLSKGEQEVRR